MYIFSEPTYKQKTDWYKEKISKLITNEYTLDKHRLYKDGKLVRSGYSSIYNYLKLSIEK